MPKSDIEGIPDVDLTPIMDDLKEQTQGDQPGNSSDTNTQNQEPTQTDVKKEVQRDLAQFKDEQALLKGYKELQAFATKTSQENKMLKAKIQEVEEQISLSQVPSQPAQIPGFEERYVDDPQGAIQEAVLLQRTTEILEDEQEKDPQGFNERYAYAQRVIQQYPNLGMSARGIKKAFELGDKLKKDMLKQTTNMALESVFGEALTEEEQQRLIKLVKGDKRIKGNKPNKSDAYMPDTSMSNRRSSDARPETDAETKQSEAAAQGDVDGVLDAMFQDIVAE